MSLTKEESDPEVLLFTDGACSGNPGPGGWAFLIRHVPTGREMEKSGAERLTTNNKMEMRAVIEGLKRLTRPTRIRVVSDSSYVLKGITEWIHGWKRNGWRRKSKKGYQPLKNARLWKELDDLVGRHEVTFEHVRGHSGHPENERCDELAVAAYRELQASDEFEEPSRDGTLPAQIRS